jgi:hypothetical protein
MVVAPVVRPSAAQLPEREYRDPAGRFVFSYPAAFGTTATGTNDGFGDRVAAVRFSTFSTGGIGGEAALTKGTPMLDVLAAGGLYDAIAAEALTPSLRALVDTVRPRLTPENLCDQIGRERHVDATAGPLSALPATQRTAIEGLDLMGSVAPSLTECTLHGATVTFVKEAGMTGGAARRRVYGAVRFLAPPYSTFQLIRAGGAVNTELLADMRRVVESWRQP